MDKPFRTSYLDYFGPKYLFAFEIELFKIWKSSCTKYTTTLDQYYFCPFVVCTDRSKLLLSKQHSIAPRNGQLNKMAARYSFHCLYNSNEFCLMGNPFLSKHSPDILFCAGQKGWVWLALLKHTMNKLRMRDIVCMLLKVITRDNERAFFLLILHIWRFLMWYFPVCFKICRRAHPFNLALTFLT